jgi:eukaryotic-like serine/threonine-protein kinase
MTSLVGKTLSNRYRIEESLGQGGMAEVYKAWDMQRATYLALKVLRQDLAEDRIFLRRFQREAQTLGKLQHPNIVRFYGIEVENFHVFMLMDYIEGTTLQRVLFRNDGEPLNQTYIMHVVKSICSALHYAHTLGLVHCDIKPGNIMINHHSEVLLTDFGIARMTDTATATMVGFGTPAYMAPELVRGHDPTPQSDIYSLGIVLYEMVTGGERPFTGERAQTTGPTSEKVRWEQVHLPPTSPKEFNTTITDTLEGAILKCLAKAPEERFSRALDLLYAVEPLLDGQEQSLLAFHPDDILTKSEVNPFEEVAASISPQEHFHNKFFQSVQELIARIPVWVFWVGGLVFFVLAMIVGFGLLGGKQSAVPAAMVIQQSESSPVINQDERSRNTQSSFVQVDSITSTLYQEQTITLTETPTSTVTPTSTITPIPAIQRINDVDGAVMVFVAEGEFLMGSNPREDPYYWGAEGPAHEVYVDAFWIYQTEVTNFMYQACVAEKACPKPLRNESRTVADYYTAEKFADYPVIQVNWTHAVSYCKWVGGRLPTEAEWEKAARGTDGRLFPWGNTPLAVGLASFCGSNCPGSDKEGIDDGYREIAPVGIFPNGASPYGALDMAGNVWEWVFDYFDQNYYSRSEYDNPRGPASGSRRVIRGGSWYNPASGIRTVARASRPPNEGLDNLGFRCVFDQD